MALKSRYQLHVDAAGQIGKEIGYLLLGVISPMEFIGRLVDSGVDGVTAKNIANDINTEIFLPLQEIMRNPGSYVPARAPESEDDEAAEEPITTPQPIPRELAGLPSVPYASARDVPTTLPGSPIAAPMPPARVQEPVHSPAPVPAYSVPEPTVTAPEAHPAYPIPAAPQQGWHSAAAVHIYVPSHGVPFEQMHAPIPAQAREAMPVPVSTHEAQEPMAPAALAAPSSVMPEIAPVAVSAPPPTPIKKDYGADPYREPI